MRVAIGSAFIGIALLLLTLVSPPVRAVDMDKLHREAFTQWTRWIVSRDEEKRRIAAKSLGGFGEQPQTVTLLATALPDKDAEVRRLAASSLWTLADDKIDIGTAVPALRARLNDVSPAVRVQAAGALERSGVDPAELVAARRGVLSQGDWFDVALATRDLIGSIDGAELVAPLLQSLHDGPRTRDDDRFDAEDVLEPLAQRGGAGAVAGLMRALDDPRLPKVALLDALGSLDPAPDGWRDALLRTAREPEPAARVSAARHLRTLVQRRAAGSDWVAPMLPLLRDADADVRATTSALFGAGAGEAHAAVDSLLDLLAQERDDGVRHAAVVALGAIGNASESFDRRIKADIATRARPTLERIAADAGQDEDTREAAQEALQAITGGTATHTKPLVTSAPGDAAALQRLRERDIEFTEDAFWRALGERDVQTVQDMLDAGFSPQSISADGMPALHFIVMVGCDYNQPTADETRRIVAALIAHGANPNQREPGGDNPALHRASSCDAALVKQLIAAKADIRARNASQLTAFPLFVVTSPGAAAALLDAGYRPDAKERVTVQAMLDGERDPAKRKVLARALAVSGGVEK